MKTDAWYMEARNALLAAIDRLDRTARFFRTPDGTRFSINRRPPLRLYLLMLNRQAPGAPGWEGFSFQRNGRVNLGGTRKVPLRQAMAAGHEPWASRQELADLAAQIGQAVPER